jgi:hypothetical protein
VGEGSGGREFVALGEEEESILSKKGNKGGGVVSSPISLSFVLSVEEEDERRKKNLEGKFIKLLSLLLLQEGITTFAKREIKPQHTQNPKEAKLEKPSTIPPFSQESLGIIVGFLFSSSKSFLLLLFVAA